MTVAKVWDGTQWVAIVGAQGPQGVPGPQGVQGIPGGTMSAANYRSLQGPVVASNVTWVTMDPRAAGVVIDPAGSFIENSDKSISVLETGWYDFSVQVCTVTAGGAPVSFNGGVHAALGTTAGGFDLATAETMGSATTAAQASVSATIKLTPTDKVFISGFASAAANLVIRNLTIARSGGPKGQMEIYEQPTEPPATAQVGAIWIDTDEAAPSGGNVPAGGTTGQILTKTGATDFAADWQAPTVTGITGQTYAVTAGYTKDRAFNPASTTMNEVAAVLATLIDDMKTAGLIKP